MYYLLLIKQNILKKSIISILILVISLYSFSQDNCNCEQALNQLIEKVESDYPGFKEKTTYKLIYSNFKEGLKSKAKNIQEQECFDLLETYLDYFKDGHINLTKVGSEEVIIVEEKEGTTYSKIKISKKDFNKHISNSTDELEGVWKSGAYKVGIIKKDKEYQAFIIESDNKSWKANQVKFSLMKDGKVNYFMGDHSLREDTYALIDGMFLSFERVKSIFLKNLDVAAAKHSTNKSAPCLGKISSHLRNIYAYFHGSIPSLLTTACTQA